MAAVFFVYCLIVFTAVIFAVSNSSIVLMSRYCCKLVVIKEQFCNFTCTYYTYRSNKSPFKKNGRGSPVPAPLFDLFLFAIECNSISFFFILVFSLSLHTPRLGTFKNKEVEERSSPIFGSER